MSNLRDFLDDSAQKCRLWSRTTTDLSLAEAMRDLAQDLKGKDMKPADDSFCGYLAEFATLLPRRNTFHAPPVLRMLMPDN